MIRNYPLFCFLYYIFTLGLIADEEPKLYPVLKKKLYGYIDSSGRIAIEPKYLWAVEFHSQLALVEDKIGYKFIDSNGKTVIDLTKIFSERVYFADRFSDGVALIKTEKGSTYIDSSGKKTLTFNKLTTYIPSSYNEGLAIYGKYSTLDYLPLDMEFQGLYGFMDLKGNILIQPTYQFAYSFCNGLAAVQQNDKWGFIDKKGSIIIPCKYDSVNNGFSIGFYEGLAAVEINNKWGFISEAGKLEIPFNFEQVSYFSEGLVAVKINNKWGFIDKNGNIIIKPIYKEASIFSENLAAVRLDRDYGYINKQGNIVIPFQFYGQCEPFKNGLAKVRGRLQTPFGYINKQGILVWDIQD